jgi:putative acyl-CoA dehydrogenase
MSLLDDYGYATHEVLNQPPELSDYDAYATDPTLRRVVAAYGADWAEERLTEAGRTVGSAEVQDLARQANRHGPELRSHDRYGRRIDEIEFHPAWHRLMSLAIGQETHCFAWTRPRPGAQVARAALSYLWNRGENGICCPLGMTYSAIPVLEAHPEVGADWARRLRSDRYDPRPIPAERKAGSTCGMAMTEKQGGSDLRQTQTVAHDNGDGTWSLVGHKWFFSVPHSDVFLTLAQTPEGVTCFVVPGWLPDGTRNRIQIQRLKEKCGNRSNASSEVEFRGALARPIGEIGHGIRTGISMNHYTRLDFGVGSAGLMRQMLSLAAHHTAHRRAFQKSLIDQPIMAAVVADMALEVEAATWLAFRFVAALDRQDESEAERLIGRIGAPIAKYWICKRAPAVAVEALECMGGNGFIEEGPMARLFREAPLNGIWEGTGNVICLDVLRSIRRAPDCVPALLDEMRQAAGQDRRYDAFVEALEPDLREAERHEGQARRLVERTALALSAGLLLRHAEPRVAEAFVASRLAGGWSGHFGDLPTGLDAGALARAAVPALD